MKKVVTRIDLVAAFFICTACILLGYPYPKGENGCP